MYSVYQHWDPLKVCVVGRSYPPEFYSWITDSITRQRFEKLAEETEEDYQGLIRLLESKFNVRVMRPEFPKDLNELYIDGKWVQPPTAPRDYFLMIDSKFLLPTEASSRYRSSISRTAHLSAATAFSGSVTTGERRWGIPS